MKSLLDVLRLTTEHFESAGLAAPRRIAEEALSSALGIRRLDLYLEFDKPLTEAELTACRRIVSRCATGEPTAYVTGEVEFYGLSLEVNSAVLIPRPETELLVERVVGELAEKVQDGQTLVDVGTGSGCIGLAIKKSLPELNVVLVDICPKALEVACYNAKKNSLAVEFHRGDFLTAFKPHSAHYVVSNPPYVTEGEFLQLSPSVMKFEPRQALVAGPTGLECYERLAHDLPRVLVPGGKAWFEIGTGQGKSLIRRFGGPPWGRVSLFTDWSGHDRFLTVELEPLSRLS